MSLKAGRVGVNPADVDPINGRINPSSIEGYTKAQADAKFETQEAAAALQSKTLAVPIHLLDGSALTVETALHGINNDFQNDVDIDSGEVTATEDVTIGTNTTLEKKGNVVFANIFLEHATKSGFTTIATIPDSFKPKSYIPLTGIIGDNLVVRCTITPSGNIQLSQAVSDKSIFISGTWLTN